MTTKPAPKPSVSRSQGGDGKFQSGPNSENCEPQYGVLPSSIAKVTCPSMSAFMLQDPAPWIALQAMDGSGELCPY